MWRGLQVSFKTHADRLGARNITACPISAEKMKQLDKKFWVCGDGQSWQVQVYCKRSEMLFEKNSLTHNFASSLQFWSGGLRLVPFLKRIFSTWLSGAWFVPNEAWDGECLFARLRIMWPCVLEFRTSSTDACETTYIHRKILQVTLKSRL